MPVCEFSAHVSALYRDLYCTLLRNKKRKNVSTTVPYVTYTETRPLHPSNIPEVGAPTQTIDPSTHWYMYVQ